MQRQKDLQKESNMTKHHHAEGKGVTRPQQQMRNQLTAWSWCSLAYEGRAHDRSGLREGGMERPYMSAVEVLRSSLKLSISLAWPDMRGTCKAQIIPC